ncbi:MAG: YkgJ family cysteine cluster protein [Leptolyngbya sp. BL-A-14]
MNEVNQSLQNLDTQIESRVQAIRADRDWWPCRRGCDACCRNLAHPPELSQAEWERVDMAVTSLPAPVQAAIEQRIDSLLQRIRGQVLSSAVVCPYLNAQEGTCWIYDSRPIACRTYGFFAARDHNQYCEKIETEVNTRQDDGIIWGNAEAIRHDVERISSIPILFEQHYHDRGLRLNRSCDRTAL